MTSPISTARHGDVLVSNAVHPGVVATSMVRKENLELGLGTWLGSVAYAAAQVRNALFAYSPERAAVTVLGCLVGPCSTGSGRFYVPVATEWAPRHERVEDDEFGKRLWEFSEGLVEGR